MNKINWGIIGCGDVTEVKSGPAFGRIKDSHLAAVMRRDTAKAEDYARRHNVPRWYGSVDELLADREINAVYIATPPGSHAQYAIMAAEAGKHIYVEKPMALNYNQCKEMIAAARDNHVSLFVAYYRRALPYFLEIKKLLENETIGVPRFVNIRLTKPAPAPGGNEGELPWRFNPEISGGGLFVDLGAHQLDLLEFFFGPVTSVKSFAANQAGLYPAEDIVCANFTCQSGVLVSGTWCFTVSPAQRTDIVEIVGSKGKITFSTFNFIPITAETETGTETFNFERPLHIQEALIQTVVNELLGRGNCPCTATSAARTSKVIDDVLAKY